MSAVTNNTNCGHASIQKLIETCYMVKVCDIWPGNRQRRRSTANVLFVVCVDSRDMGHCTHHGGRSSSTLYFVAWIESSWSVFGLLDVRFCWLELLISCLRAFRACPTSDCGLPQLHRIEHVQNCNNNIIFGAIFNAVPVKCDWCAFLCYLFITV